MVLQKVKKSYGIIISHSYDPKASRKPFTKKIERLAMPKNLWSFTTVLIKQETIFLSTQTWKTLSP